MAAQTRIGIIIVSYGHEGYVNKIADALGPQKTKGDLIVIVDNHFQHKAAKISEDNKYVDLIIESENMGFAAGIRKGVDAIIDDVEYLFFLNPDTNPAPDLLKHMRNAVKSHSYAAYMPLLMLPDGTINSSGNEVHISGLSWCGGYQSTPNFKDKVVSIKGLSGACTLISTEWWIKTGGMSSRYFLYYEDTDLSARIELMGGTIALITQGIVVHDYDYGKGSHKWFYLERNRPLFIIETWPLPVIILLLLELLVVEPGLWAVAILEKRFVLKVKATISFFGLLPKALADRRQLQSKRVISSYEFLSNMEGGLTSTALGSIGQNKLINGVFKTYRAVCLALLKPFAKKD